MLCVLRKGDGGEISKSCEENSSSSASKVRTIVIRLQFLWLILSKRRWFFSRFIDSTLLVLVRLGRGHLSRKLVTNSQIYDI